MKKGLGLLSAVLVAMLLGATNAWAESGKCPPDKKAVESFCQQKAAGKAEQCVKEITANCKQDQLAAEKTRAAEKAQAAVMPESGKGEGWYAYHLCVHHYGGTWWGCAIWLAR